MLLYIKRIIVHHNCISIFSMILKLNLYKITRYFNLNNIYDSYSRDHES